MRPGKVAGIFSLLGSRFLRLRGGLLRAIDAAERV